MTIVVGFLCYFGTALAVDNYDYGLEAVASGAGLAEKGVTLPIIMGNILGTVLSFIGVLFFVLMVFGGFLWMTARGNEEQTKKALGTITSAVVGLVIVLSSYAITSFVFKTANIADVSEPVASVAPAGATVAEKDKACAAAKTGWTCNSIDMCAGNIKLAEGFDNKAEDIVKPACTGSGNSNCLFASTATPPENLCTTTAGSAVQVCCQAKPASAIASDWCFDPKTAKCDKLADVGAANCVDPKVPVSGKIEEDCYTEKIKAGFNCSKDKGSNGNCATSFTGFVCINNECVEQPSAENEGKCLSSADCKTGVCKVDGVNKICKYLPPCTVNRQNTPSTQTCTAVSCGVENACTSDAQCGSDDTGKIGGGYCVNGKCESGKAGASCESDIQCGAGNYCTSQGTPSCCLPELDNGGQCWGMDNACKSGSCIEKAGFDVCE